MTERPPCERWDPEARKCSLGYFGGRPSPGVCLRCDAYVGPDRGMGDTIHNSVTARIYRSIAGDCEDCEERRRKLNQGD